MAFADTLVAHGDAEVVLVDRRHRPGGHRLDAYSFVRLDQPSAYYGVLDETLVPTGRARFLGMHDYRGGNVAVSLLDGSETMIRARRRVVDATYVQSEIPARHDPPFAVEAGVTLIAPKALVDLAEPADRFTIVGAGKTACDTCVWPLEQGVDPDSIRWIRGRDPWQFNRALNSH